MADTLSQHDTTRLIGYVTRFKREVADTSPFPTGLDDCLDWLDAHDWDTGNPTVIKLARREWMRG